MKSLAVSSMKISWQRRSDIFNPSVLHSEVPNYFNQTTVIPVPKKNKVVCLNDCPPLVLTSTIIKCFERLVMAYINSSIPASLEPLQFAYVPQQVHRICHLAGRFDSATRVGLN